MFRPSILPGLTFWRDVQFRLEYLLLRLIVGLVRAIPLDRAIGLSASAWRILAPKLAPKRHARALANLAIAFPEKPVSERTAIALAHWENLGRVMVETMQLDRIIKQPERIEIANPAVFARYKDKLGPLIGVSLHMGNWELAIWPLTVAGANPAAIYRAVNNPYVDRYLRHQRRDLYPGGLFGRGKVEGDHGDKQMARQLMEHVKHGGRLGIVSDLYDRSGIPVPFFGQPARTVAGPALIARRTGARVWMARAVRLDNACRFRIEMVELQIPRSANAGADILAATAMMQAQFEAWVREMPDQWMWSNRRWS
jgi:Kdo2-lipid IVA lauroyltransferase/acyltransferase